MSKSFVFFANVPGGVLEVMHIAPTKKLCWYCGGDSYANAAAVYYHYRHHHNLTGVAYRELILELSGLLGVRLSHYM